MRVLSSGSGCLTVRACSCGGYLLTVALKVFEAFNDLVVVTLELLLVWRGGSRAEKTEKVLVVLEESSPGLEGSIKEARFGPNR